MVREKEKKTKGLCARYTLNECGTILKASKILDVSYSQLLRTSSLAIADKVIKEANKHKKGVDEKTFSNFLDKLGDDSKEDQ